MTKPGIFLVANYETAQPAEMAFDNTPYCWIVETQKQPATDTRAARITADLAGYPGRRRHSQLYVEHWRDGINHIEAAMEFLRARILPPNSHAQLVSMANTSKGMLFVFM